MNEVGRVHEPDAARFELGFGGMNIRDPQVEDRFASELACLLLGQHHAYPAKIEEGEIAEAIKLRKAERFAIPGSRFIEPPRRARHLPQHHVAILGIHGRPPQLVECSAPRDSVPAAQLFAARKAELAQRIAHVKLHRIETHAHALGDAAVGHAVPDLLRHPPFGGRQHVIVPGASWSSRHGYEW